MLVGKERKYILQIEPGQELLIGREVPETEGNIRIQNGKVSRIHACIGFQNGFYIMDMESKNGTLLNTSLIKKGEKAMLSHGDSICLGEMVYEFREEQNISEDFRICHLRAHNLYTINGRKLCIQIQDEYFISYQFQMMEKNSILRIPECQYVRSIASDALFFDITDMISLQQLLENVKPDVTFFLQVMEQILKTVKEGEKYLLDKEQYVLTKDMIWIREKDMVVYLIYLPLKELKKESWKDMFMGLLNALYLESDEKAEIQHLLQCVSQETEEVDTLLRATIQGRKFESVDAQEKEGFIKKKVILLRIWIVPIISMLVWVVLLFMEWTRITDLIGLGIILSAFNLFYIGNIKGVK